MSKRKPRVGDIVLVVCGFLCGQTGVITKMDTDYQGIVWHKLDFGPPYMTPASWFSSDELEVLGET